MPDTTDPSEATPTQPTTPTPAATSAGMKAALEDRSMYIRTMAKDMATFSGAAKTPNPPQKPVEESKSETVDGVTLAKEERPFFEKPQSRAEREGEEAVALPSMQEASSIVTSEKEVPSEKAPGAPGAPAATPTMQEIEADRAAVLERLRQKVGQNTPPPAVAAASPTQAVEAPAPIAKPPSVPEQTPRPIEPPAPKAPVSGGVWANIPQPAPQFAPLPEPQPARIPPVERASTPETYREPIEQPKPARPLPPPASPEALHTYTSDFSDRIDTRNASTFSVLAAEQDAGARKTVALPPRSQSTLSKLMPFAAGMLLLVLAGGGIFFTYQFVMTARDTPMASLTVPSIVFADEYRELEGFGEELMQSLAATANSALVPGNVLVTYITTSTEADSPNVLSLPAGGDSFIRALQIPAPDILLRNVGAASTIGAVNASGETRAFFALRVDSYERTYAGMLTWEPLLLNDLAVLYPLHAPEMIVIEPDNASTTTATSTPEEGTASTTPDSIPGVQAVARTRFEDAIVANRDVRRLADTNGRTLVLYGYADKRTLIIARDEAAFESLLTRLKPE